MPSQQTTIDYLLAQCASAGGLTGRKMFGEYTLYCDEKLVALIADDAFFVKITPAGRAVLDESHDAPPYEGAKPYLRVPREKWDDAAWMGSLIRGTADALPAPKPKPEKRKKAPKPTPP
jgi:DNA transformation protein